METEAKFVVPDEKTFAEMLAAVRVGPYSRRDTRIKIVHDRYLDTPGRKFHARQLYLRLRQNAGGGMVATVKRLGSAPEGAVHTRDEYEVAVPGLNVADWPQSDVRQMVEETAGNEPLTDVVSVDQTRTVSVLQLGTRSAAELSLDEVTILTPGGPLRSFEAEVEMLPEGVLSDLRMISHLLVDQYPLQPQPFSKFERALLLASTSAAHEDGETGTDETGPGQETQTEQLNYLDASPDGQPDDADYAATQSEEMATEAELAKEAQPEAGGAENTEAAAAEPPPTQPGLVPPPEGKRQIGVLPTDSAAEAGRKMLRFYFDAMMSRKEGTKAGDDPEMLHDMRVATRRMRAALRVLEPYWNGPQAGQVRRGVRAITRALGAVRDLDVLIENAERFRDSLPEDQRSGMDGLLDEWNDRRKQTRKQLLRLLDSKDFSRFKKRTEEFVSEQEAGDGQARDRDDIEPHQVRHIAGSAIWSRYEAVRAFETVMDAPTIPQLHALRIKGKYLRYTLECFRETLPSDASTLIAEVVKLQDELGALHDADVAAGLVRDYKAKRQEKAARKSRQSSGNGEAEQPETPQPDPGLAAYLADREAAIRRIYAGFLDTWSHLSSPEWRAKLAAVITAL